jgi:GntR family galactonate operon transcriptional repressor
MTSRLYPQTAVHARIAHEIGRRIAGGDIAEGELLPRETELQEEFSASRQAVREALKVLGAKGMIVARKKMGTLVQARSAWNMLDPDVLAWHAAHTLPEQVLRDLVEMRRLIEPSAAAFAAERATPKERERIGEALTRMRARLNEPEGFYQADIEFHLAIFAASGNCLIDRMSTILGPLLAASFRLQRKSSRSFGKGFDVHASVFEAISQRDPSAARAAMERLLDRAITEVFTEELAETGPGATQPRAVANH